MTLLVLEEDSNNNNNNNNNNTTNNFNDQTTGSNIDNLISTLRPIQQDVESPLDYNNVVVSDVVVTNEANANTIIQQSQQQGDEQQQQNHGLDNESTAADNDNNNNCNIQEQEQEQQQQQQQQQVQQLHRINSNIDNDDGDGDEDDNDPYIRQWKQSPFAIGISYPTWKDESIPYINTIMKRICCCIVSFKRPSSTTILSPTTTSSSPFNNDYNNNNNNNNINYYPDTDTSIIHQRMKQNASPMWCTPVCCRFTPFGRVGNMVVLFQRTSTITQSRNNNNIDSIESGQIQQQPLESNYETTTTTTNRPIIMCMVGPYWPVLVFVTLPILIGIAVLVSMFLLPEGYIVTSILYISIQSLLIFSLLNVSCRNPGIQYRYRQLSDIPPTNTNSTTSDNTTNTTTNNNNEWIWNDQALTYRLQKSVYDRECACVIENFDHTCPWTGTAIGKNNIYWFYCFLILIIVSLLFDIYLFTFGGVVTIK